MRAQKEILWIIFLSFSPLPCFAQDSKEEKVYPRCFGEEVDDFLLDHYEKEDIQGLRGTCYANAPVALFESLNYRMTGVKKKLSVPAALALQCATPRTDYVRDKLFEGMIKEEKKGVLDFFGSGFKTVGIQGVIDKIIQQGSLPYEDSSIGDIAKEGFLKIERMALKEHILAINSVSLLKIEDDVLKNQQSSEELRLGVSRLEQEITYFLGERQKKQKLFDDARGVMGDQELSNQDVVDFSGDYYTREESIELEKADESLKEIENKLSKLRTEKAVLQVDLRALSDGVKDRVEETYLEAAARGAKKLCQEGVCLGESVRAEESEDVMRISPLEVSAESLDIDRIGSDFERIGVDCLPQKLLDQLMKTACFGIPSVVRLDLTKDEFFVIAADESVKSRRIRSGEEHASHAAVFKGIQEVNGEKALILKNSWAEAPGLAIPLKKLCLFVEDITYVSSKTLWGTEKISEETAISYWSEGAPEGKNEKQAHQLYLERKKTHRNLFSKAAALKVFKSNRSGHPFSDFHY